MTKEQIIKSIECCEADFCAGCPIDNNNGDCRTELYSAVIDLARDLCKERLLKGKAIADFEDLQEYIRKEKSEAIREFAERLKERNEDFCIDKSDMAFVVDSIVKEMTRARMDEQ